MEATANTGQNDTSSGSIYNLFDKVAGAANAGLSIYNSVKNPNGKQPAATTTPAATVAKTTTAEPTWKKYLPWIIGGGLLLGLLTVLFRK